MEAIKRVRWQHVALVLLVLLIIVVGIVAVWSRRGTSQSVVGGGVTATRASQTLQLAPQSTPMLTIQASRTPTLTFSPSPITSSNSPQWQLIFSDDFNASSLGPGWGAYNGPHGKGVGPYAILWPQSGDSSTQVDIFESPPVDNTLYFTNHGGPGGVSTLLRAHGSFAAGFHTLTCIWLPGQLQFLDGARLVPSVQNHKRLIFQLLALQIGEKVLDAGCGTGDDVRDMSCHHALSQ